MQFSISLARCASCDHEDVKRPYSFYPEDSFDGHVCDGCGAEVVFAGTRPARWVGIAAYDVDRAYGGPEEGGWYYDAGTVIPETIRCFEEGDIPAMQAYRELLEKRYPDPKWQVDGRVQIRTYTEEVPPMGFPRARPAYS